MQTESTGQQQPKHEFWVLCPSSKQVGLVVWCAKTGARGIVTGVTQAELADSYNAIENPYRWQDESRVRLTDDGKLKAA